MISEEDATAHDDQSRNRLATLLRNSGLRNGRRLHSGQFSKFFIDAKQVLQGHDALRLVAELVIARIQVPFDAVGGPSMGADPIAHMVSLHADVRWFSVRKTAVCPDCGQAIHDDRNEQIEGLLRPGDRVLLVDDVVSTGASLLDCVAPIEAAGARVVAVATLLDRGEEAAASIARRLPSRPYVALTTYNDIGIEALQRANDLSVAPTPLPI